MISETKRSHAFKTCSFLPSFLLCSSHQILFLFFYFSLQIRLCNVDELLGLWSGISFLIKTTTTLSPFLVVHAMAAEAALFFSVASVVEDVLQQHGPRLKDLDLESRKAEEAGTFPLLLFFLGFHQNSVLEFLIILIITCENSSFSIFFLSMVVALTEFWWVSIC